MNNRIIKCCAESNVKVAKNSIGFYVCKCVSCGSTGAGVKKDVAIDAFNSGVYKKNKGEYDV